MNTSIHAAPEVVRETRTPIIGRRSSRALQMSLLFSGILSSLLYIAMNIIVPAYFPGYNAASQTVSELSAIDAPSRQLWLVLATIYSALVILFGLGIWISAGGSKKLMTTAVLMLVFGASGFFWPPMHQREVLAAGGGTLTDSMHIAFAAMTVFLMMFMIGFAGTALGKRFSIYSIGSIVLLIVFGVLTGLGSPGIAENLPTPLLGVWERINIGVFMLWLIVLAAVLLRRCGRS
jgi:hypothetical protein